MKYKVLQMRGGAPDKIQLYHHENIELIHMDFCNLVDMNSDSILDYTKKGIYILPADEMDIKHANITKFSLTDAGFNQECILLPHTYFNGVKLVIPYYSYVPKDSIIYKNLELETGVKYARFSSYTLDEFHRELNIDPNDVKVYKTTVGSGSRGVILVNPNRLHLGGKYRKCLVSEEMMKFIQFAKDNNANIMIQDFIPEYNQEGTDKLVKVNVDFIIRDGRLLGYKWDKTDPTAVFTNWNFGWFHRSVYTDQVMKNISDFLINKAGITDAIMNFEAFSDHKSETWMVEFNWRYSNSMFEWQALDIDPIYCYLEGIDFSDKMPYGNSKFTRYWQCSLYKDISNYKDNSLS